ncbi:prolipoprotein diacylglyceryl transferase family protein [Sphingomonas sp. MMS24-JH45]
MVLLLAHERPARAGSVVGIFLAGYGLARFTVEFFREPDQQLRQFAEATGLHMGQWLCVPMIAGGAFLDRDLEEASPAGRTDHRGKETHEPERDLAMRARCVGEARVSPRVPRRSRRGRDRAA